MYAADRRFICIEMIPKNADAYKHHADKQESCPSGLHSALIEALDREVVVIGDQGALMGDE